MKLLRFAKSYCLDYFLDIYQMYYVRERNTTCLLEWRVKKVPEAFCLSKMAYHTLQQEYLQIPVVTRAYTTACVLTTAAVVRRYIHMLPVLARTFWCGYQRKLNVYFAASSVL